MAELEDRIDNPEFIFENIARASKAARGLFLWLSALKNYYYIYMETLPRREVLVRAEKQRKEKEMEIESKRSELFHLEDNLQRLKKDHEIKESEIRLLQRQIDECSLKKERATKLLNGLGCEKQKWLVCNRMIAKKFLTI
jgi:dynein heavy chain